MPPFDEWVIEEIKKEIKHFLEITENDNTTYQSLWDTEKAGKQFITINICHETRKISNKQPNNVPSLVWILSVAQQAHVLKAW
jgi:hypothetical protein